MRKRRAKLKQTKQDYKAPIAARRICEVEGEGVINERVAQRWFHWRRKH